VQVTRQTRVVLAVVALRLAAEAVITIPVVVELVEEECSS
jgi:hypothetical protein